MDEAVVTIDGRRLRQAIGRRPGLRLAAALLLLLAFAAIGHFFLPRSFTSSVSISIQQPSTGVSSLAALPFLSTNSKKYIGVVKSRRVASEVEDRARVQSLYSLPLREDAVDRLMKSVIVDDSPTD